MLPLVDHPHEMCWLAADQGEHLCLHEHVIKAQRHSKKTVIMCYNYVDGAQVL